MTFAAFCILHPAQTLHYVYTMHPAQTLYPVYVLHPVRGRTNSYRRLFLVSQDNDTITVGILGLGEPLFLT